MTRVGGDITAPAAAKITATYADGATSDIPFVWVSSPIAAGFYTYDIPTAHWNKQNRLLALTLYAKNGTQLGRQTFPYEAHPSRTVRIPLPTHIGTPKQRVLPTAPNVPPSAPTEQGSADGFKVVVGHNGSVQFTQISQTPILEELVGRSAGFSCFRLTNEFGIFTVRGLGQGGRFAPKVGFELNGVGRPVDGCEVEASIGRVWPDRLHNRAAVEIPLTAAGRSYFADRQAARDLALFVRSRRMHELRKEPANRAKADILRVYGKRLAGSPITITATGRRAHRHGTEHHRPNVLGHDPQWSDRSTESEAVRVRVLRPRRADYRLLRGAAGGRERPQLDHSQAAKPSATIARNSRIHSTGADVFASRTCRLAAGWYDGGRWWRGKVRLCCSGRDELTPWAARSGAAAPQRSV